MARKDKSSPRADTPPSVDASRGSVFVKRQIDKAQDILKARPVDSDDYEAWENTTREVLIKCFGSASDNISSVGDVGKYGSFPMNAGEAYWEQRRFENLGKKIKLLGSCLEQLELDALPAPGPGVPQEPPRVSSVPQALGADRSSDRSDSPDLEAVLQALRRFDTSARTLGHRRREDKQSKGFSIEDEYDVQDFSFCSLETNRSGSGLGRSGSKNSR